MHGSSHQGITCSKHEHQSATLQANCNQTQRKGYKISHNMIFIDYGMARGGDTQYDNESTLQSWFLFSSACSREHFSRNWRACNQGDSGSNGMSPPLWISSYHWSMNLFISQCLFMCLYFIWNQRLAQNRGKLGWQSVQWEEEGYLPVSSWQSGLHLSQKIIWFYMDSLRWAVTENEMIHVLVDKVPTDERAILSNLN